MINLIIEEVEAEVEKIGEGCKEIQIGMMIEGGRIGRGAEIEEIGVGAEVEIGEIAEIGAIEITEGDALLRIYFFS